MSNGSSKKKGYLAEKESAAYWSEVLKSKIVRTPTSGAIECWKSDLTDLGDSIIKKRNYHIEIKGGNYSKLSKKFQDMLNKAKDDSDNNLYWLELHQKYAEPVILITRNNFSLLLKEINYG